MDKPALLKKILNELELVHKSAVDAAQRAYDTATDEENEAENKYDTLGLEASYLAHGQAKRVVECEADLIAFRKLEASSPVSKKVVVIGALVYIEDNNGEQKLVFLSPVSGGLKVKFEKDEVTLVTSSSPLGKSLLDQATGDIVQVDMAGNIKSFEIIALY